MDLEKILKPVFDNAIKSSNRKLDESINEQMICPYCGNKGSSTVACITCDEIVSGFRTPFSVNKPVEDKPVSSYQRLVQRVNEKFSKVISSKWCKS